MPEASRILNDLALDTLFRSARTYRGWLDRGVSDVLVHAIYDLMKLGPTSLNSCPARFLFVRSKEAKARLEPCLDQSNREKTMAAPITAIIAHDLKFYEYLPKLSPHNPNARKGFEGKPDAIRETAMRNGTLQGAYLIMAARSLGLDCGPMSGFDKDMIKATFFPEREVEVNFLCNIGYGDPESLRPRLPRFDFDDACGIV